MLLEGKRGSEKWRKSVTYYFNGPLTEIIFILKNNSEKCCEINWLWRVIFMHLSRSNFVTSFQVLCHYPCSSLHGLDPDHQFIQVTFRLGWHVSQYLKLPSKRLSLNEWFVSHFQQFSTLRLHSIDLKLPHATRCCHLHTGNFLAQNNGKGQFCFLTKPRPLMGGWTS